MDRLISQGGIKWTLNEFFFNFFFLNLCTKLKSGPNYPVWRYSFNFFYILPRIWNDIKNWVFLTNFYQILFLINFYYFLAQSKTILVLINLWQIESTTMNKNIIVNRLFSIFPIFLIEKRIFWVENARGKSFYCLFSQNNWIFLHFKNEQF